LPFAGGSDFSLATIADDCDSDNDCYLLELLDSRIATLTPVSVPEPFLIALGFERGLQGDLGDSPIDTGMGFSFDLDGRVFVAITSQFLEICSSMNAFRLSNRQAVDTLRASFPPRKRPANMRKFGSIADEV